MNRLLNVLRTNTSKCWIAVYTTLLLQPSGALFGDELIKSLGVRQTEVSPKATTARAEKIAHALRQATGATDETEVAAYFESLRSMGSKASTVADAVAELLNEASPLYRNRDKHEVMRLRAYVFVVLSEIGIPPSAFPQIVDALANSDDEMGYHFGAAARAAATLGPPARPLIPHLCAGMQRFYHRDEFSLERYDPDYPQKEATTVQGEAIKALAQISTTSDKSVVELLSLYGNGTHPDTQRFPGLIKLADRSLRLLRSKETSTAADSVESLKGQDSVTKANNRSQK